MRKSCFSAVAAALILLLVFSPLHCFAAAKVIKNVRVSVDGKKQYYDLFQSPVEKSIWYCGQTKPSVLMRQSGDQEIPEISLIRFQKKDVKNPQNLIEGAHFRMYLSLGPSEQVLEELKKKIPDAAAGKLVVLSPVPFGALQLYFQKPDGRQVKLDAEPLAGFSSQHSSQNVAFSTLLGVLDTDLLDALLRGNTGAKYLLLYNYQYVDPVASGKPAANLPGGRDFEDRGTASGEKDDRNLPGSRDFDTIEKEIAQETGWEKAGEGFIGFGKYSKSIQDMCVIYEKSPDGWENAYMTLPAVFTPSGINISRIELGVTLMHGKKAFAEQTFTWTPAKSWRDRFGAPLVYGVFDLSDLRSKHPDDLNSAFFAIKQRIESDGGDALVSETSVDMLVGNSPVTDPLVFADILEFDTGLLTWAEDGKDGLKRIEIELRDGDWKSDRTVKPEKVKGRLMASDTQRWLVRRFKGDAPASLTAEVNFVIAKGQDETKVPWAFNGSDLRARLFDLSVIFFDKDWSEK